MELGIYRIAEINKGGGLRQKAVGLAGQYLDGTGAWANMPTSMTPTAHNHVAADITSGTLALARIPTGTTSSTVALGNHMHLYAGSASAGGPATTALACTGNSATATKLETTRALTIGNTAKNFDGSAAVSWTLAEIGAASSGHTHIQSDIPSYMYHEFSNGAYYFDDYNQKRYFRLYTETAPYDCARFCTPTNVEYWNGSAYTAWAGGEEIIKILLDGREETEANIDHTHRQFRFVISRNGPWPTNTLLVIQTNWTSFLYTGVKIEIETWNGSVYVNKATAYFDSAHSGNGWGIHCYSISTLHDGLNPTRITVTITDWTDAGAYTTFRFKRLMLLSNYSGGSVFPWTWNFDKKVTFSGGIVAPTFSGNGASLTSLNASSLSSGTVPIGRLPTGTTSTTVAFGDHTHSYSPTSHASSANTYGLATASLYGHAMASSATPLVAGTASAGTDNGKYAREGHVHPLQTSVSGSSGSCTGNAATATSLATARTLTIGNTGKDFDGTAAVSWSLSEIGAATSGHNHDATYLKLSGGTLTGNLTMASGTWFKNLNTGWDDNKIPYFVSGEMTVGSITTSSFALATHSHALADLPKLEAGTLIMGTGSSTALGTLARGANGQFLSVVSNRLAWVDAPSGGSTVSPANPTASVGLAAKNGTAATFMRSDAAPKLDVSIAPTWTGAHTFNGLTRFSNIGIGVAPSAAYKLYVVEDKEITTAGSYIGNYLIAKYNTALTSGTRQGIAMLGQLWATGGTLSHAKGMDFKVYVPSGHVEEATAINAVIQTDGGSIGTAYALKLSRSGTAPTVANYGIYQADATATNVFNGPCQFNGGTDLLPSGTNGQFLSLVGGAPAWVNAPSGGGGRARNFRAMTASGAINHTSGTDTLIIVTSSYDAALTLPTTATTGDRIEFYSTLATAYFTCESAKIWPINNSSGKVPSWGGGMGAPAYCFAIWDGTYWRVGYLNPQY